MNVVYSQEFTIASIEGLNFENLQTSDTKIETSGAELSNTASFEKSLLETKSSHSHELYPKC